MSKVDQMVEKIELASAEKKKAKRTKAKAKLIIEEDDEPGKGKIFNLFLFINLLLVTDVIVLL